MIEPLLILTAGPLEAALAPAVGGCIARLDYRDGDRRLPVLRGADAVPERILDAASFPLVPFCNRIRGGIFRFRGRTVQLRPNMPPDPSPLHGQGWLASWQVLSRSERDAQLVLEHEAGEWPWDYRAVQHFSVDENGLTVRLDCTNRSMEPMPCGLGQHPYFPCSEDTRLDTEVVEAWTIDQLVLPVERVPAEGRYDLRNRRVCRQDLDNGFGGWSGSARMATPGLLFRIEMTSPEADYFQLYSPRSEPLFVAEPVTHANAALNQPEEDWAGLGLRVLEPGTTMSLTMRIEVIRRPCSGRPSHV